VTNIFSISEDQRETRPSSGTQRLRSHHDLTATPRVAQLDVRPPTQLGLFNLHKSPLLHNRRGEESDEDVAGEAAKWPQKKSRKRLSME